MHQNRFRLGLRPRPCWRAYDAQGRIQSLSLGADPICRAPLPSPFLPSLPILPLPHSLPLPLKRGSGVLPRKILKFQITVGEFQHILACKRGFANVFQVALSIFFAPVWGGAIAPLDPPLTTLPQTSKSTGRGSASRAPPFSCLRHSPRFCCTIFMSVAPPLFCFYCVNCTKFGQLVLRIIIKIDATKCVYLVHHVLF